MRRAQSENLRSQGTPDLPVIVQSYMQGRNSSTYESAIIVASTVLQQQWPPQQYLSQIGHFSTILQPFTCT